MLLVLCRQKHARVRCMVVGGVVVVVVVMVLVLVLVLVVAAVGWCVRMCVVCGVWVVGGGGWWCLGMGRKVLCACCAAYTRRPS